MWKDNEFLKWMILLIPVILAKGPDILTVYSDENNAVSDTTNTLLTNEKKLKIDTANLTVYKVGPMKNATINILLRSDECYQCAYYELGQIYQEHSKQSVFVDTKWGSSVMLKSNEHNCSVDFDYFFGEYGHYSVNFSITVFKNNSHLCSVSKLHVDKQPQNSNLPILVAFLILLSAGLLYTLGCWLYKRKRGPSTSELLANDFGDPNDSTTNVATDQTTSPSPPPQRRQRLKSIDTFRGLCIVIMIFVNYKGGNYWFFHHSTWNGLTVADLVFPWFMFIMGVNITLSVESLLKRNTSRWQIAYKVVRRTVILFTLGVTVINHNTNWSSFRVPGVLQRFAISYLVAFLIQWSFHISPAQLHQRALNVEGEPKWWYSLRDILAYWPQWIIVFLLETLWLLLTFLLPVPGCPTGYLGPGGLADGGKYTNSNCIGGAAGYIDRWMFGEDHIYGHPTAKVVYYPTSGDNRIPYDPEGVLGAINSCIIVFLGTQMGKIFLYYEQPKSRSVRWFCWSMVLGVISIILCKASANGGWIPVNKNLWTITFVTTLSCFAFFLMIVIYWLVDELRWWSGSPLDFVGMNSILLYLGHETFEGYIPFGWGATQHSTHAEWLAMNILGVFYWVLIAYYCYKIKFFVKI